MFKESIEHDSNQMTWSVVLQKDSNSISEDKYDVMVSSATTIGPKDGHLNVSRSLISEQLLWLTITCCIRGNYMQFVLEDSVPKNVHRRVDEWPYFIIRGNSIPIFIIQSWCFRPSISVFHSWYDGIWCIWWLVNMGIWVGCLPWRLTFNSVSGTVCSKRFELGHVLFWDVNRETLWFGLYITIGRVFDVLLIT